MKYSTSAIQEKVLVSVIIPVYNVEDFLAEAIESVLDQSFGSLELILVNDGSTDHSASICQHYVQKDSRVKFIAQQNSGVSVARNNGLLHAKGAYVFFMDSDDTIDKDFIRTSYQAAKNGNNDIVVIGAYYIKRMPDIAALPTCAQMIRLDFLNEHPDIRFPANIQPCEDGLFSHQLLALTQKIGLNPHAMYHYREHEKQNHIRINKNTENVIKQIPVWLEILEQFYTRHHLFKTHALHLALFMEHEPFEFRYLGMPLNKEQKDFLHRLIKTFMAQNVFPFLKKEDEALLTKPFRYFLSADNYIDFDTFYSRYLVLRKKQRKLYWLLTKFVFINSIKQRLRKNIRKNFDR